MFSVVSVRPSVWSSVSEGCIILLYSVCCRSGRPTQPLALTPTVIHDWHSRWYNLGHDLADWVWTNLCRLLSAAHFGPNGNVAVSTLSVPPTTWNLYSHMSCTWGYFKNAYELFNLRALKFSPVNKIHKIQCMSKIFCVDFEEYLWNSTQNILPTHWKMQFLHNVEILRALRFERS